MNTKALYHAAMFAAAMDTSSATIPPAEGSPTITTYTCPWQPQCRLWVARLGAHVYVEQGYYKTVSDAQIARSPATARARLLDLLGAAAYQPSAEDLQDRLACAARLVLADNAAHELRRQVEEFAQALEQGAVEVCDGV